MKQIILVRHELNMRKGKIVAQACHGSNAILLNEFTKYPFRWSIYFIVKKYYKWIGKDSISNNVDVISLYIKKTNEFEHESIIETLLSNDNFSKAWNEIDNMVTIREKIREKIIDSKINNNESVDYGAEDFRESV